MRHLLICILCLAMLPSTALAASTSALTPSGAISLGDEWNGRTITVRGEAIGDVLRADNGRKWVNVLGGGAAIGVYMTAEQASAVTLLGDYRTTGTTLQVTGTYNAACAQHAGDRDVHAASVTAAAPGRKRTASVGWWKAVVAAAGLAMAVGFDRSYRRRRRQLF